MALPYEAPRSYTAASGGIPVAVDPADALKKSIAATQTNLSSVKDLGRKTDNFMVNQYTGRVPGYKAMSEQSSANIAAALRGEVPQDVLNQMAQQAAERGISRGVPGAQASNADYLRGLGLTSLGLQKYGEEALTGATHRLDAVKQFDPTTFSVTPEAQYNAMTQANVLGAAPNPEAVYQRGKADLAAGSGAGTRTGGRSMDLSGIGGGRSTPKLAAPGGGGSAGSWSGTAWNQPAVSSLDNPDPYTYNPDPYGLGYNTYSEVNPFSFTGPDASTSIQSGAPGWSSASPWGASYNPYSGGQSGGFDDSSWYDDASYYDDSYYGDYYDGYDFSADWGY